MAFWEELLETESNVDFILTPNYLHRNLVMREGLVRSDRNINLYGDIYQTDKKTQIYKTNLSIRIQRQLKFAWLIFDWLFDHYNSEDRIITKMASRIWEAWMLLYANDNKHIDLEKYYNLFVWNHTFSIHELSKEIEELKLLLSI